MSETPAGAMLVAMSNTGPLISAFQCGRTDVLKRYCATIYITTSALVELEGHGWTDEIRQLIAERLVVVIQALTSSEQELAEGVAKRIAADPSAHDPDWHAHLPEAEAMVLMQQRRDVGIDIILLDEQAARRVAQELGLRLTGFPGMLGRAGLDGLLTQDDIRQLLKRCQQQGTHDREALIEMVARTYGR